MVAAVTHMSPHEIEWDLPLARGLQFQAIWLDLQGNVSEPASCGVDTSAMWKQIAGR